jgi:acetyl-CoA carboxylase carboxyltransferase component
MVPAVDERQDEIDELERRARWREHGGADAVARQRERGRGTVRERIAALADKDSFREYGDAAGRRTRRRTVGCAASRPRTSVMGRRASTGVPCHRRRRLHDPGRAYTQAAKKGQYADALAIRRRIPWCASSRAAARACPAPTSSAAARATTSPRPPMNLLAEALATVPVACAALGPCAGFPAARLAASHFSVMTKDTAVVLTGGPDLVERATGKRLSKEELGGAKVHTRSGVVDNEKEDEDDALRQIRAFLSYLPASVSRARRCTAATTRQRAEEELLSVVPRERRRAYKIRRVIELVLDRGSFFELAPLFGRSQVTGLARIAGHPVGGRERLCTRAAR